MSYKDEEILKAKKAIKEEELRRESQENMEKEIEESIYDKCVHIIGEEVTFERRVIPELNVSIFMPENFFQYSEEDAKMLYPAGNTPSHIYGGLNIHFQMLLTQTENKVPDDGMKEFVNFSAKLLEAVGPKVTIIEKSVEEKEDFHIGMVSFVSKAMDGMVYNVQFYLSMDGKLFMGSVTFQSKYKKRMIPLAKEIIQSIEILREEEK